MTLSTDYTKHILEYLRRVKPRTPALEDIVGSIPRHPDVMLAEHGLVTTDTLDQMVAQGDLRKYDSLDGQSVHYCLRYDNGEPGTQSMPYSDYLQTSQWLTIRRLAMDRAEDRCQVCNHTGDDLEVHHRTYRDRGQERLADLTVLCRGCHDKFHGGTG